MRYDREESNSVKQIFQQLEILFVSLSPSCSVSGSLFFPPHRFVVDSLPFLTLQTFNFLANFINLLRRKHIAKYLFNNLWMLLWCIFTLSSYLNHFSYYIQTTQTSFDDFDLQQFLRAIDVPVKWFN